MQHKLSKVLFLSLLLVISNSCKKDLIDNNGKPTEEQLREDAEYNNSLIPGLGNVFYEQNLIPGSESQLVSLVNFKGDTVAYYGKISASGNLEYIHTTVLAKSNSNEQSVTEIFKETSTSRSYNIKDGKKGKFVFETQYYTPTEYTLTLLDYDWDTKQSKVISTIYMRNGVEVSRYEAKKRETNEGSDCELPSLTDDIDEAVRKGKEYFSCISNPIIQNIEDKYNEIINSVRGNPDYYYSTDELNELNEGIKDKSKVINDLDKDKKIKYSKLSLSSKLKLIELMREALEAQYIGTNLEVDKAASDLEFDEISDKEIELTIKLTNESTHKPVTNKPLAVDLSINTGEIQLTQFSNPANGTVTFKFDPTQLKQFATSEIIPLSFKLSMVSWQLGEFYTASINHIKPKVVLLNGSDIPSPVIFKYNTPQSFKLVNEDGRAITVDYSTLMITNITNTKTSIALFSESSYFTLQGNTTEKNPQTTGFAISYNNKIIKTITAEVVPEFDSLAYYIAMIPGNWTMTYKRFYSASSVEQNNFTFNNDLTGVWTGGISTNGQAYNNKPGDPIYRVEGTVQKNSTGYYLEIKVPDRRQVWFAYINGKGNLDFFNAYNF